MIKDITGQTFGFLTVIKLEKGGNTSHWLCRCVCGTEKVVTRERLVGGRTKSCGCKTSELRRQALKKTRMKTGYDPRQNLSSFWDRYEAFRKALEYISYYDLESKDPAAKRMREVARNALEKYRYESD